MSFVPNTVRVSVKYNTLAGIFVMTHAIRFSALTQAKAATLATDELTFWSAVDHLDWLSTSYALNGINVTSLADPAVTPIVPVDVAPALATLGTDALGEDLPLSLALAVKLSTGLGGRSRRGRMYFGGFRNRNTSSPVTVPTTLGTDILDSANDLLTTFTDDTTNGQLVVASRKFGYANDVTVVSSEGVWDRQVRRLRA